MGHRTSDNRFHRRTTSIPKTNYIYGSHSYEPYTPYTNIIKAKVRLFVSYALTPQTAEQIIMKTNCLIIRDLKPQYSVT